MSRSDPEDFRWTKWWWQDYDRDPGLRSVSLAAQGLWMRMLCLMAEGQPYGHLTLNGKPMPTSRLAKLVGTRAVAVERLLAELDEAGVFDRSESGAPFCRRMVKDFSRRQQARIDGASGGNPALVSQQTPPKPSDNSEKTPDQPNASAQETASVSSTLTQKGVNPSGGSEDNPHIQTTENEEPEKKREVAMLPLGASPAPQTKRARAKPNRSEEPEGFAEWYQTYPRHEGRKEAAAVFSEACRKAGGLARLMELTAAHRFSDEPRFIPHPARWLRKERWNDQPLPGDARSGRVVPFASRGEGKLGYGWDDAYPSDRPTFDFDMASAGGWR